MKIRLLPSNITDPAHLQPLTCFLVNETLAMDGGSLGFALSLDEQRRVSHVIVSHTHSDHIATLPIFIAEAFPFLERPVTVCATRESIASLRENVFNGRIWPDFERIRLLNGAGPGLQFTEIEPYVPFEAAGLSITAVPVNHTVPTVGFLIEDEAAGIVFSGDTYETDALWEAANRMHRLDAVFVDVSYPNELEQLAADSKHFTPQTLLRDLAKLRRPVRIFAVHIKPQQRDRVVRQLEALGLPHVGVGEIGRDYVFPAAQARRGSIGRAGKARRAARIGGRQGPLIR